MNYFIRNRKINPKDIIYYQLNKKCLSTKIKILNFNKINYVEDVSSPALFKLVKKIKMPVENYKALDLSIKNSKVSIENGKC